VEVRDVEDQLWTLLKRNGTLFLDVSCEHSAVGYNVLIELDASERLAYAKLGRSYLSELAERINYSAPGALGNTSPYTSRNVANVHSNEVVAAVQAWRSRERAAP
jgi:hypothetical protein